MCKIIKYNWFFILIIFMITILGVLNLYSASGGNLDPWAYKHIKRFLFCLSITIIIATVDIKIWYKYSYIIYFLGLAALIILAFFGSEIAGAQRWIKIGPIILQPSEVMKVSLIAGLSRFYSDCGDIRIHWLRSILIPFFMVTMPLLLVINQPDLGTAILIFFSSIALIFVAGISYWLLLSGLFICFISMPFIWSTLHTYQKERVLTFLNPERDPLGSGYHIIQSKIAIGSGGFWGKGFLKGSQSHLEFIPEIHTDFIFSIFSEEFGFFGSLIMILLFILLIIYGLFISYKVSNSFSRLLVFGLIVTIFFYVFTNIAMVMGLIPVVGVPLPLVSYGGSAMLTIMSSIAFIMSANYYNKEN